MVISGKHFLAQFEKFLRDHMRCTIDAADEQPHFFAFLEDCVSRPRIVRQNSIPVRASLVERTTALASYLRRIAHPLVLTDAAVTYARELAAHYEDLRKGAPAITDREFLAMLGQIDRDKASGKQMVAVMLLQRRKWARPSELLRRLFPDDVCADYDEGIVITVRSSKTNPGIMPEYFAIPHDERVQLCSVCALANWLKVLGDGYRGPLFPGLNSLKKARPRPWRLAEYNRKLAILAGAVGITKHVTSYSLRKAGATATAARGGDFQSIKEGLRHERLQQSLRYVDLDVLLNAMPALRA